RLLPLVYLRDILGFERKQDSSDAFIVVTQVGSFVFGIVVDQVFDTEEIVVKPVSPALSNISVYSGNTILGDGSVIMILDPNGVASQVSTTTATENEQSVEADMDADAASQERETMLVFRAGGETPKAVPLSLIARLEEIDATRIENRDVRPMVQYRGTLMPVLEMVGSTPLLSEGQQPILVFTDDDRSMGIACDEILDIVETVLDVDISTQREGVVGSAVIAEKVTEIIDVSYFSKLAFKDWFEGADNKRKVGLENKKGPAKVLVVEDSAFFRNMLRPLLAAAGYSVTIAKDAEEALALRERSKDFDLIISDIEMPGQSGFEFAQDVRDGGRWKSTPMIALSSLSTAKDFERGRKSGFNDYVVKLDRDALLETMEYQLESSAKRSAA
ncbi:MAG: chemotaxis protein CheW, partial [Pseudomonadota bacterium]